MPEDQDVLRHAGAEHMLKEQRALAVVARVVEAGSIGRKTYAEVARGGQFVLERLAGFDIENVDTGFIRSALLQLIDQQAAIPRHIRDADRGVRVPAQLGGVDQALVSGRPPMAHINRGLLLAGQALGEKVTVASLMGRACGRDIFQRVKIVHYLGADGGLLQIAAGVGVLSVDESAGLRAFGVFKPAKAVEDLDRKSTRLNS